MIAKVFDHEVYTNDINQQHTSDSAFIVNEYLENLATDEGLYLKAKESGWVDEEEVEKKTDQFRKSYTILNFEHKYVNEKLDTIVSENELKEYFGKNEGSILLHTNIFKGYYVVLPTSAPKINRLKELLASDKEAEIQELKGYCSRNASSYSIEKQNWVEMPSQINRHFEFNESLVNQSIQYKKVLFFEKDDNLYLVRLFDFKFAKQPSPYPFSKEVIRQILLNKRKIKLLTDLRQELLSEAKSNNKIEIY